MKVKIASRKSDLARIQAQSVGKALGDLHPDLEIEFIFKESLGDINLHDPLWKMPERGVFTEDFVDDLKQNRCDLVVHSYKDLPTALRPGLEILATLPRADSRDVLLMRRDRWSLAAQMDHLKVFSSSPRREYNLTPFLKWALPQPISRIEFLPVRGNVPTRLKKLFENEVDALIVAKAAIDRLLESPLEEYREMQIQIRNQLKLLQWMILPLENNPPAAAQGALAIEGLAGRGDLRDLLAPLHCESTAQSVALERQILASHGGGCHQKIGVHLRACAFGKLLHLRGLTDAGEVLQKRELLQPNAEAQKSETSIERCLFPPRLAEMDWFEREDLPESLQPKVLPEGAYWVAKASALPERWKIESKSLVWVAGPETWRRLAERGIWINGSSEALGENELLPDVDTLAQQAVKWSKLSHEASMARDRFEVLATYRLKARPQGIPDLSGYNCFYWPSYSHFLLATQAYPKILEAEHFSGPGNTRRLIEKQSRRPVKVCLSFESFIKGLNS